MYQPKHFKENDLDKIYDLMRAQPLATLVTLSADGIEGNHIPLVLDDAFAPYGTLQGHIPRANPLASNLVPDTEALAIFHGPNGYITPSWYPTKQQTGKVVPTWNYAVVHAYGHLEIIDDSRWVRMQIEKLTNEHESLFPAPWQVSDAPSDYIDRLIRSLVGIELKITKLLGKTKASQNQPTVNQAGVVEGLQKLDNDQAARLANLTDSATAKNR